MQELVCRCCSTLTNEFTILSCDHVLCTECLWQEVKTSLNGHNSIHCPCGKLTTFSSPVVSPKIATTKSSPRCQKPHFLKSQVIEPSSRTYSYLNGHGKKNSNISQSQGKIGTDTRHGSDIRHKINQRCNTLKASVVLNGPQGVQNQLRNQLQFLNIQFRKSMQEAQKNYQRLVQSLKAKYNNLVRNIKLYWLEEIVAVQPAPLLDMPKLLLKKYNKAVGSKIQKLNDHLIDELLSNRTENKLKEASSQKLYIYLPDKENRNNNRVMDDKTTIMRTIADIKEDNRLRKIAKRGSHKYRFL